MSTSSFRHNEEAKDQIDSIRTISFQSNHNLLDRCTDNLEEMFYMNVRFLQRLKQRERTIPSSLTARTEIKQN